MLWDPACAYPGHITSRASTSLGSECSAPTPPRPQEEGLQLGQGMWRQFPDSCICLSCWFVF